MNRLEEIEQILNEKRALIKSIQDEFSILVKEKENLLEEKYLQERNNFSVQDWLFEDGFVNGIRYKDRDKYFENLNLYTSGYWPDINQVAISISTSRNKRKQLNAILSIIDHIKVHPKENAKIFSVSTSDCSEHGSIKLHVYEDNTAQLKITTYGSTRDLSKRDSLSNTLNVLFKQYK